MPLPHQLVRVGAGGKVNMEIKFLLFNPLGSFQSYCWKAFSVQLLSQLEQSLLHSMMCS